MYPEDLEEFDNDLTDQELIEMDGPIDVPEESPQGGLVLQVLDHRGGVEDIIIGLENIREYIKKLDSSSEKE